MSDDVLVSEVAVDALLLDDSVYPRTAPDQAVVERYAAAMRDGDQFPPIDIKAGTYLVLNGWHRVLACRSAGIGSVAYVEREVPAGVSDRLMAASFASREGQPLSDDDAKAVARGLYEEDPNMNVSDVARKLARPRKTVEGWLSGQIEKRREAEEFQRNVRQVLARMLSELGWKGKDIAAHLGVAPNTVSKFMHGDVAVHESLDEAALQGAIAIAPESAQVDVKALADQWREERIFATWAADERALLDRLRNGEVLALLQERGA